MEKIYQDEEVLELTRGNYMIYDASVTKIDIYIHEQRLNIDIYFTSIESKRIPQTNFKLSLIDVILFDLLWDNNHHFYIVERYKLLRTDKGFYISLDPIDETDAPTEGDGAVIIGKNIKGYLTN